jgi:hypothetical protein
MRIPFDTTDAGIISAWSELPEQCRKCPEALELMGGAARALGIKKDLIEGDEHAARAVALARSGLEHLALCIKEEECHGPVVQTVDVGDEVYRIYGRPDCGVQWLYGNSSTYGMSELSMDRFNGVDKSSDPDSSKVANGNGQYI